MVFTIDGFNNDKKLTQFRGPKPTPCADGNAE